MTLAAMIVFAAVLAGGALAFLYVLERMTGLCDWIATLMGLEDQR